MSQAGLELSDSGSTKGHFRRLWLLLALALGSLGCADSGGRGGSAQEPTSQLWSSEFGLARGEVLPPESTVDLLEGGLDDWIFYSREPVDRAQVWSLENGVLRSSGDPAGYLQTRLWYRDYRLQLRWRWPAGGGNSGVLLHVSAPQVFHGWPRSLEVQLQSGDAGDFWIIGQGVDIQVEQMADRREKPKRGDEHRHRRVRRSTDAVERALGQWNDLRVECRGDQITVFVNDVVVNHALRSTISEGAIGLQSEGTSIEFRDVRLSPL